MKFVMLFLLASCASLNPVEEAVMRHSIVVSPQGFRGSAVAIGNGYLLTVRHVIFDSSGVIPKETIIREGIHFSPAITADTLGELVVIEARNYESPVLVGRPRIGDKVYWIQPLPQGDRKIVDYLMSGVVSGIDPPLFFLDKPMWPGSSGTGIFNEQGELIGVGTATRFFAWSSPPYPILGVGIMLDSLPRRRP